MAKWAWGQNFVNAILGLNGSGPIATDNPLPVQVQGGGVAQTVDQGTGNGGSSPWAVQGGVAAGATDSGNPVKTGGIYLTSLPTLTNGQRGNTELDVNGRTITTLGTLISGESQTFNTLEISQKFLPGTAAAGATTVIKSGAARLKRVIFGTLVAGGTCTIYDNTAASGTKLLNTVTIPATITADNPFVIDLDEQALIGITVVMTGTAFVADTPYL